MPIRLLPPQLANQIAAGEVVERPASVVKELVENSLDAGATEIRVDIEKGGARRIRIRDNGSGIPKEELTLALSRHATSKISSLDDLEAILSLGFRGEALASISSVSRLRLTSRTAEQEEAWQAFCEGRDMQVMLEPAAHPQGTTVDVEDLFFNTPARRKFLRTEKTEFGHIDEVVRRIALARPDVAVILTHNQQVVRHYPAEAASHHDKRLHQVAGRRFAEDAIFLEHEEAPLSLRGWVAPPDACRHQSDIQYMYVNGRMMRDKLLNHAIRQAYGDALPADRQPTFILYLNLPAKDVDVNVHPAKHEVRFHFARQIHDFVLAALKRALLASTPAEPEAFQHGYQAPDPERYRTNVTPSSEEGNVEWHSPADSSAQHVSPSGAISGSPFFPTRKHISQPVRANAQEGQAVYQQMYQQTAPVISKTWQPMGMLAQRYAIMRTADTLALLDCAQLSEIITTNRLQQQFQQGLSGQPLLVPVLIQGKTWVDTMQRQAIVLNRLGIVTRIEGRNKQVIEQVPHLLRQADVSRAIAELCEMLEAWGVPSDGSLQAEQERELLAWLQSHRKFTGLADKDLPRLLQDAEQLHIDWRRQLVPLPWEQYLTAAPNNGGNRQGNGLGDANESR